MESIPLNESPYIKQGGVNDYLRDKQASKTEENSIFQNPSIDETGDTSGYDTITTNTRKKRLPMIIYKKMQTILIDVTTVFLQPVR